MIFLSYKKLPFQRTTNIFHNDKISYSFLECKNYVKYLGIPIDNNLNWKTHTDFFHAAASETLESEAKRAQTKLF